MAVNAKLIYLSTYNHTKIYLSNEKILDDIDLINIDNIYININENDDIDQVLKKLKSFDILINDKIIYSISFDLLLAISELNKSANGPNGYVIKFPFYEICSDLKINKIGQNIQFSVTTKEELNNVDFKVSVINEYVNTDLRRHLTKDYVNNILQYENYVFTNNQITINNFSPLLCKGFYMQTPNIVNNLNKLRYMINGIDILVYDKQFIKQYTKVLNNNCIYVPFNPELLNLSTSKESFKNAIMLNRGHNSFNMNHHIDLIFDDQMDDSREIKLIFVTLNLYQHALLYDYQK